MDLLAPFDGNAESVGDAIVGNNSHFFIIEFKRTLSKFSSEYVKYKNGKEGYEAAKSSLVDKEGFKYHYAIGGEYDKIAKKLTINIRKYFDIHNEIKLNPCEIFSDGMSADELNEYTELFTKCKKSGDDADNSDSAGSGGLNHSFVLAVDINKKTAIIPIDYYIKHKLENKNVKEHKIENKRNFRPK
ncbi:hypothetical protein BIY26_22425 [Brenneria goodwinii]|uniref:Uncharacterized protein n=1 Tax=Brenneria goodwinii TaxID=1109412 RepID=A0AAE8EKF1_9GAMM|nr:hypothetical protein [Brenneria goodwinii]ATA26468.1 hypothetical protein AWC36_21490 [Brenneria goodwinii]RLM16368.1 hypothetical protein BIY26_22425 [Brenneria goodwinii]